MAQPVADLVLVDDLLIDLMSALGVGHRKLIESSTSDVGALAVKSAEVTVQFDMSAESQESRSGVSLGVRPAPILGNPSIGFDTTDQRSTLTASNHAMMVIQIVNVPTTPDEPERPAEKKPNKAPYQLPTGSAKGPTKGYKRDAKRSAKKSKPSKSKGAKGQADAVDVANGTEVAPAVASPSTDESVLRLLRATEGIREAFVAQSKKKGRKAIEREFAELIERVGRSSHKEALDRLVATVRPHWRGAEFVPPTELLDELQDAGLLAVLADEDDSFRTSLTPGLTRLAGMVETLGLPARITEGFQREVEAVLASASQTEARGRLVGAMQRLQRDTADQPLPEGMHQLLAGLNLGC